MKIQELNKNYDFIAEQFSTSRHNLRWPLEDLFLEKLKMMNCPRILDLGCGSGRFFQYLKNHQADFQNGFDYVGLDQSIELIKKAQTVYPEGDWRVGTYLNLANLNLGKFDAVVALASFHHLPRAQQKRALVAVRKIMKNGAYLFLTVWNLWNMQRKKSWWSFMKDRLFLSKKNFYQKYQFEKKDLSTWQDTLILWQHKIPLFYYVFRQKELQNLVQNSGFFNIVCQYENVNWCNSDNLYLIAQK